MRKRTTQKARPPVKGQITLRVMELVRKGYTRQQLIADGFALSTIARARERVLHGSGRVSTVKKVSLDWEVWQRTLEPVVIAGKQAYRRWWRAKRFATRAECNIYVDTELRQRLYAPADFHIANEVIGWARPANKGRVKNETPETRHRKRKPWEPAPRGGK